MKPRNHRERWALWSVLLLVVSFFVALAPCYAQIVNAALSGTVTDTTGGVVPQATVTATNVNTGIATKTTSDAGGNYILPSLAPGTYSLTVEKSGFKSTVISGMKLSVDQKARVDAQLQVGEVTTKVQVQGAAPLVDTVSASLGTVMGEQPIADLPLNLRRVGTLAALVPGTIDTQGQGMTSSIFGSTFAENGYTTNGSRSASNLVLIDGMASRSLTMGGFAVQPPPEAVEEFKIQNNIYDATFGMMAGSVMNLVTKSGTNDFHGDVWEFLRNDKLDARNFFATNQVNPFTNQEIPGSARPEFRRNQFGFGVGGPIRRNKTFFFGSYEGLRQIQGMTEGNFVPTDAEKAGDFSSLLSGHIINLCGTGGPANLNFDSGQLFDPASESLFTCPTSSAMAGSQILVGNPIPGNVITNIDPVAQKVLPHFPEPNRPGFPNFINQQPIRRSDNQFDLRIDHTFSPKDHLFGRYIFANTHELNNELGITTLPGITEFLHFRGQNGVLGWTHTFGPDLLNEVRVGWQRNFNDVNCAGCPRPPGTIASFGIKNLQAISPDHEQYPEFGFVNFAAWGDAPYQPNIDTDQLEKYSDTLTWIRGRHTLMVGADMNFWQSLGQEGPFSPSGEVFYNGQFSSLAGEISTVSGVADLADFELGFPDNANHTIRFATGNIVGGGSLTSSPRIMSG